METYAMAMESVWTESANALQVGAEVTAPSPSATTNALTMVNARRDCVSARNHTLEAIAKSRAVPMTAVSRVSATTALACASLATQERIVRWVV